MLWFRVDTQRLEGSNDLGNWSVETYRYKGRESTHVRLNGRLKKYALSESDGVKYVEHNSEVLKP